MKIYVAIPAFNCLTYEVTMQSMLGLQMVAAANGVELGVRTLGNDSDIVRVRCYLATEFFHNPQYTHMLMIDGDMGFNPNRVLRLMGSDKELVGAPGPTKSVPGRWAVALNGQEPVDGFVRSERFGFCLALIARSCFEKMAKAYPEQVKVEMAGREVAVFAWFCHTVVNGWLLEVDHAFLHRWHAIGGQAWIDTQSDVVHAGTHYFQGPGPMLKRWNPSESIIVGR